MNLMEWMQWDECIARNAMSWMQCNEFKVIIAIDAMQCNAINVMQLKLLRKWNGIQRNAMQCNGRTVMYGCIAMKMM